MGCDRYCNQWVWCVDLVSVTISWFLSSESVVYGLRVCINVVTIAFRGVSASILRHLCYWGGSLVDEYLLMFFVASHLLVGAVLFDVEIRRGCNLWCE